MREDLLGYLLEALDEAERERLEQALRNDPELQRRLEDLKEELQMLAGEEDSVTPPPGLAEQTCAMVAAYEEDRPRATGAGRRPATSSEVSLSARARRELVGGGSATSFADLVVGAGIFLAASFLFLPAIANSRFHSEVTACQYNLQLIGDALTGFSENRGGLFPQVPTTGKRAVAGVYAPTLVDNEFLTEPRVLICPASNLAILRDEWFVPTLAELDAAEGRRLVRLQRLMGGSYGYTLGYLADGRYRNHRNERRPHFGLMADAPSFHLAGHQSSNHGGRGQNVLYEDGRVEFVTCCYEGPDGDFLFLNRHGFAEAGTDKHDAVIVASEIPPFPKHQ
jgi:hypothetical protein